MLSLQQVLRLHSAIALGSGLTAVAYPPFFGRVFPSLTSAETLAFVVRMYSVLVATQPLLLSAFRQVQDKAFLRRVAAGYCGVFAATGAVAYHAEFVAKVATKEVMLTPMWLAMSLAYGALAVKGHEGTFKLFSYFHTVMAGSVGVVGIVAPRDLNYEMLRAPRPGPEGEDTYNSISRYYGTLIVGMSYLTSLLTTPAAAPAQPRARAAIAAMWGGSAVTFAGAIYTGITRRVGLIEEPLTDAIVLTSLTVFASMSALYAASKTQAEISAGKRQ